eukprot:2158811-Prorocentrum_lima.AAC.1
MNSCCLGVLARAWVDGLICSRAGGRADAVASCCGGHTCSRHCGTEGISSDMDGGVRRHSYASSSSSE